jgi:alkylation response protein AidB-like acyl-CoA dehydrogenase
MTAIHDATDEGQVLALTDQLVREHGNGPPEQFYGAQFDMGLAFVHFPVGHGGLDLPPKLQLVVNRRITDAGIALVRGSIGHGMAAPTIVTHGTEEQKRRFLRPLFTNEEVWCQLFSEPGAGSDVASLATTAVRDGDEWIVNGQKVWTSLAHNAKWGLLFARTDPDVEKHKGLTYFAIDMHQPGVDVRPLRQITGQAEFNEVFFTDARVPDANRLGGVGDGWRVALTTLMNERVSIGGSVPPQGSGAIAHALAVWRGRSGDDPVRRDQLARLWIEAEVARLTNWRAAQMRSVGTPGPEGSVGKLAQAELNQRIYAFCVNLLGADGMLFPEPNGYELDRTKMMQYTTPHAWFLRSRANSIEGGTSEVMRNILGERVLGLPVEPRVDKGVAFRDLLRN